MLSIEMTFFTLTFFVLIECFVTSTTSDIHHEAIVGERTELECTSDQDIDGMKWEHIPTGSESIHSVYFGRTPSSTYAERFSLNALNQGRTRKYNLVIDDVQKEDAGQYICRDQEHQTDGNSHIQLTILETSPICLFAIEHEDFLKTDRSCLQADDIRLTCKVNYFGDTPPVLIWRSVSGEDFNNTIPGVRNGVENSIRVTTQWDQFTFMCHSASLQGRPCHVVIPQPAYIFRSDVERTLNGPQTVTCSANSSQSCTYQWLEDNSNISISANQHLEIARDFSSGIYICAAVFQFRGVTCHFRSMLINFHNEFQSIIKSRNILIVVLCVLGGIFGIIIVLYVSIYIRHRGSSEKLRNSANENANERPNLAVHPDQIKLELGPKIKGLTFSEKHIYVVRQGSHDVWRFLISKLEKVECCITFSDLKEPRDLCFSSKGNNLYVTDSHRKVFKMGVDLQKPDHIETACEPDGISITSDNSVIIAFPMTRQLIKYSKDLKTEKLKIELLGTIVEPRHALEMSDGRFLVCYGILEENQENPGNGVVIVNEEGQIEKSCKHFEGESAKPLRMLITFNEMIVVATYEGKEVLLLDPNLERKQVIVRLDHNITRMCLDSSGRLYVADHEETPTIFIFNINKVKITKDVEADNNANVAMPLLRKKE